MKAIILAAGQGTRLNDLTKNTPKCLLSLGEKTILDYQIDSLVKCGVDTVLVVTGFREDKVRDYLRKFHAKSLIIPIYNRLFKEKDNSYSLSLALEFIDSKIDTVIVLDGDILFDIRILEKLIKSKHKNALIADNHDNETKNEDCKILTVGGYVTGIGKKVSGQWKYGSMIKINGKFLFDFKEELKKERKEREWYSEPLNRILKKQNNTIYPIMTNKLLRCEVDTKEDLSYAKEIAKLIKK